MPVIARFYGLIIKMYLRGKEHNPPHIHVLYNEYNALIDIQTQQVLEGDLPTKGLALAQEWVGAYQKELLDIWETQRFRTLPPLH